jgi:hypothetical protein
MGAFMTRIMKGYVTIFDAVVGRSAIELEQVLGFYPGSLMSGYQIYGLSAPVCVGEFRWKDKTMFSGGWGNDASINESVQRDDELRFELWKASSWNETISEGQLKLFMASQCDLLNVRFGGSRIVKVVPLGVVLEYRDSEFNDVPQWELTVPKLFTAL